MKNYFLVVASLLLGMLCSLTPSYGQQASRYVPNQIPASPQAASLGKFVEVPVNLYQGLPQISIPIYEIKVGGVSVPIALKYHASGFRVSETASSVGMGWSLEAGGTLSRTLRGGDDEHANGYLNSNDARWFFNSSGYPKLEDGLNYNSSSYDGVTYNQLTYSNLCQLYDKHKEGKIDTEPDLYTFSAPGFSGKFVYNLDRKVHFVPHQNVEISSDNSATQGKNWYTLTSAQGVEYTFGSETGAAGHIEKNYSRIYSYSTTSPISLDQDPDYIYNAAWHLSKIVTKNSTEPVLFEYETETTETISLTNQSMGFGIINGGMLAQNGLLNAQESKTKTITEGGRLKTITGPEGIEIRFIYETIERKDLKGGHRLKTIEIKKYGVLIKKYELSHSYFGEINSYDTCYLKLDMVREYSGQDGSKYLPAYILSYHQDEFGNYFPTPIGRNSYAQDEWGFYNAQNINKTDFIPAFKEYPSGIYPQGLYYKNGANREINEAVNRCGMLTKIQYPTGGYHELVYEQNDYRLPTNQTHYEQIKQTSLASTLINDGNRTIQGSVIKYRIPFTVTSQTGNKWLYIETEGYNNNPQGGVSADCYTAIENSSGQLTYNPLGFVSLAPGNYYLVARADTTMCPGDQPTINIEWEDDGAQIYSKKTGGVRIKTVRTHDNISTNNDIYKTYSYTDTQGFSSGRLHMLPNFRYVTTFQPGQLQGVGGTACMDEGSVGTMMNMSAFTPSVTNHLGYTTVEESFGKKQGNYILPNALGKNVYVYTNAVSDPMLLTAHPKTDPQLSTQHFGMLLSQTAYDKQDRKLTETINTYRDTTLKDIYGVRIATKDMFSCSCTEGGAVTPRQGYIYSVLKETSDWSVLSQTIQRNYSFTTGSSTASTYQETITNYNYDNQTVNGQTAFFLKEETTTNSEGKELKTKYKYAFNYNGYLSDTYLAGIKPRYTTPIETIEFKDGKVVGATLTKYENSLWKTVPKEIYALDLESPVLESAVTSSTYGISSLYKLKAIFNYDADLRITNVTDEQEQEQSFIRVAQGSERMVVNIVGAALDKVAYMGMEPEMAGYHFSVAHGNQEQGAAFSGNYYVKAGAVVTSSTMPVGRYLLTLYTKGQGNVSVNVGSQSVSGTSTSTWQYQQLELNITTPNTVVTITPASGVALDEIRLHPVSSQMTSRTYYDWGGIRDMVDVKGQKLIYEYDIFLRLKAIKDLDGNILKTWNYHYKN